MSRRRRRLIVGASGVVVGTTDGVILLEAGAGTLLLEAGAPGPGDLLLESS